METIGQGKWLDQYTKINSNFLGLGEFHYMANIYEGIRRIPAFFRRIDPASPGSTGSMLARFVIASTPDTHGSFDAILRLENFINLIKDDTRFSESSPERMVHALMVQDDVIKDEDTKADAQALYTEFADIGDGFGVDLLACLGNHDFNAYTSNATSVVLSKAEQRAALIDPIISSVPDVEAGSGNACYYYKDYQQTDAYNVRVIVLDEYDMPQDVDGANYKYTMQSARNYSQAQLTWFAETALATPSADWHVIIFGHESLVLNSDYNTSSEAVRNIIDAFTQQDTVIMNDTTTDFEFSLNSDFSTINGFNGNVIGYFYGHGHIAIVDTITINTRDYNNIEIPSSIQSSIGFNRQNNTGTSDMATFIVVDTEDRKIFLLRFGCPCDVNGIGLPYGDLGIETEITY